MSVICSEELIKCGDYPSDGHDFDHAWISPSGEVCKISFTQHNQYAVDEIKIKGWDEEFKKSNENRGYCGKEFLIIVKGYISVNGGYPHWYGTNTKQQAKVFGGISPSDKSARYDTFSQIS